MYVKLPKTKRGEKTLNKICEAAEELFSRNGYYSTEIHDITQKAGIATGTLYVYFPDKVSLFLYLLDNLGRNLRKKIRNAKYECPPHSFEEKERISIRVFFSYVQEHFGLFRIVWQAQFVDADAFKIYYERFSRGYINEIKKSQESGEVKDFDPALLSYVLMGIYTFVAMKFFVIDESVPDDNCIDQLVDLLANGVVRKNRGALPHDFTPPI